MTEPATRPCARPGCDVIRVQQPGQCRAYFERVKFCCHECSSLARVKPVTKRRRRSKAAPRPPRTCANPGCGVVFVPKRYDHVACSERCRKGSPPRPSTALSGARYDGGEQDPRAALVQRPNIDLRAIPQDEGRYWT